MRNRNYIELWTIGKFNSRKFEKSKSKLIQINRGKGIYQIGTGENEKKNQKRIEKKANIKVGT